MTTMVLKMMIRLKKKRTKRRKRISNIGIAS